MIVRRIVPLLLLATSVLQAQVVHRGSGESTAAFVRRAGPAGADVVHAPIETDAWRLESKAIVAFYGHAKELDASQGTMYVVEGYAFLPERAGGYRRVLIGEIGPEGADPEVESVFFANATADPVQEVVVIVSWRQVHYDVSGTLYATLIYELPGQPGAASFTFLKQVSDAVSGTCECEWRDGKKARSGFKTAREVRIGLRKLGFR